MVYKISIKNEGEYKILVNLVTSKRCFIHKNTTYMGKYEAGYIHFNKFYPIDITETLEIICFDNCIIRYDLYKEYEDIKIFKQDEEKCYISKIMEAEKKIEKKN